MKRSIIALAVLVLLASAGFAADFRLPGDLGKVAGTALARLGPGRTQGQLLLSGFGSGLLAGGRHGGYRGGERGRHERRQPPPGPRFERGRRHYHGRFWRWFFGRGCWCERHQEHGRGHGYGHRYGHGHGHGGERGYGNRGGHGR